MSESTIRRSPRSQPTFNGFRRYGRAELGEQIIVQDDDGWELPLQAANLSPTGMFVESQLLFDVGDEHVLIFRSPMQERWFRVRARVVRVDEGDDEEALDEPSPGMAYEFLNTDEDTWESLCSLVAP